MTTNEIDWNEVENAEMTPSDLKAARLRLGLDMAELAQLLGIPGRRDIVENLEKSRTWTMHNGHLRAVRNLEWEFLDVLQEMESDIVSQGGVDFLIGFPNDGVFRDMEPELAERLKFNSVHRMMLAGLQGRMPEDDEDAPPIVEIIPSKYAEWLRGKPDTADNRVAWARDHIGVYKVKMGMPIIGKPES